VLSLVDFSILKKTWTYSRADFAAVAAPPSWLTLGCSAWRSASSRAWRCRS
jgi:hypothetical protein